MSKPLLRMEFTGSDDGVTCAITTNDVDIKEHGDNVIDAGKKALKELERQALRFGLRRCLNQLELDLSAKRRKSSSEDDDDEAEDNVRNLPGPKKGGPDA